MSAKIKNTSIITEFWSKLSQFFKYYREYDVCESR